MQLEIDIYVFIFLAEQECRSYMQSLCRPGFIHTIRRSHLYGDVLSLFADDSPTQEHPFYTKFIGEKAVDCGGVAHLASGRKLPRELLMDPTC